MFSFLLDLIRGPQDPTRDWQCAAGLQLEFELDTGRLNTAQMGDNYDAVSFLGPSEDRRSAAAGMFHFYSLEVPRRRLGEHRRHPGRERDQSRPLLAGDQQRER